MVVKRKVVLESVTTKGVHKPCKKVFKSAFWAIASKNQPVGTIRSPQVLFDIEKLDLGNEYNPVTSTFIPKHCGTYKLFTSVVFNKTTQETFDVILLITVNGIVAVSATATVSSGSVVINASGVLKLRSGDKIQVAVASNGDGIVKKGATTQFKGRRIR